MNRPPSLAQRKEQVAAWNRKYKPGTKVKVRKDDGFVLETVTRSKAEMLGGHTPVIWVVGIAGAYALERVSPQFTQMKVPCCERDHNKDGNCDRHPHGIPQP